MIQRCSDKLDTVAPFSLNQESENFMMPIGENLIRPRNLDKRKCYKHLLIPRLNREFIAQSNSNNESQFCLTPQNGTIPKIKRFLTEMARLIKIDICKI